MKLTESDLDAKIADKNNIIPVLSINSTDGIIKPGMKITGITGANDSYIIGSHFEWPPELQQQYESEIKNYSKPSIIDTLFVFSLLLASVLTVFGIAILLFWR